MSDANTSADSSRSPSSRNLASVIESLRPTITPTPDERKRWAVIAFTLSAAVILGNMIAAFESEGYGSMAWLPSLMVCVLASAVALSVPNRPKLNTAGTILGALVVLTATVDLSAHIAAEWLGAFEEPYDASELELVTIILIAASVSLMSTTSTKLTYWSMVFQTFAWVIVVTGLLLLAYDIGGTIFPPFLGEHGIGAETALSGAGVLLAVGAARPNNPPLAAPVMGKGIGLVPIAVGLMIFVPAVIRAGSYLVHDGDPSPYSPAGALLISIFLMVLALVYLDSRRIHSEQSRESDKIRSAEAMAMRARHDQLTGLPNRNEALAVLSQYLETATEDEPVTVLWCDVDNFRQINDGISHQTGDEILMQIGMLLTKRVPGYATVARMGSDEFLIILPNADAQTGLAVAEDLVKMIAKEPFGSDYNIVIGLTVGVAEATERVPASVLVSRADVALTRGKSLHRGSVTMFTEEMLHNIAERIEIAQQLREAIDRREFHAWGQPIVDLKTEETVGFESLARWVKSDGTVVPAYQWVDVAESHGLMIEIGDLVIEDALAAAARLPESLYVTINASGRQLLKPKFAQHLLDHIRANHVDPTRIIVEVTEATIIDVQAKDRIKAVLDEITASGMRVYLDDFGTGYSAVSHLSDFPVSGLKLDKAFTDLLTSGDYHDYQLAQGVARLAASLELQQVAEGVETQDQADLLMQAGWTCGQGWLFGKPAPYPDEVPPNVPGQSAT